MIQSEDQIATIYRNLQKHLELFPVGFPSSNSGIDIRVLKAFFTPEDAEFVTFLTFIPLTIKKIHSRIPKKFKLSMEDVRKRLEDLSHRGLITELQSTDNQNTLYLNAPFAIGFFEYSVDHLTKEKAEAIDQYNREVFHQEFISTGIPQMRTIPIGAAITPEHPVFLYDDIWKIVDKMVPPYIVVPCVCAQTKDKLGKPCVHNLQNRCITNRPWYLKQGIGNEVTKAELIELIKQAEKKGLVPQPGNFQTGTFMCLCCNCCCEILHTIKEFPKPAEMVLSNHYSEIDASKCIRCGLCVKRCPMNAIGLENAAKINLDRCIGCGVCIPTCSQHAILLRQKSKPKAPPIDIRAMYRDMWMKKIKMSPFKKKVAILKEIMSSIQDILREI